MTDLAVLQKPGDSVVVGCHNKHTAMRFVRQGVKARLGNVKLSATREGSGVRVWLLDVYGKTGDSRSPFEWSESTTPGAIPMRLRKYPVVKDEPRVATPPGGADVLAEQLEYSRKIDEAMRRKYGDVK